jgi:hypothetical protein
MGIPISLILIAVGAVLAWGVVDTSTAFDLAAIGWILMAVGFIGLAMTLAFWSSFSPFGNAHPFRRTYASGPADYGDDVVVEHPRRERAVVVRDEPTTVVRDERPTRTTRVIRDPGDEIR